MVKQASKGIKQILDENQKTIDLFHKVIISANLIWIVLRFVFLWDSFTLKYIILHGLSTSLAFVSLHFMKSMAKPVLNEQNAIVDPGCDLNMEGHISEYLKDMMILTSGVQLLALVSNYFWLMLLAVPGFAFYKLWTLVLAPWFFAAAPEGQGDQEVDDGKGKKSKLKRR